MENEDCENENANVIEEIQEAELEAPVIGEAETDDSSKAPSYTTYEETVQESNTHLQAKGKYYKQTYRTAWEQMSDFKGWLRGVQGEPTRAYCTYCQKTLHAHRLSLLKHTCTIRHQKAAQLHKTRKHKIRLVTSIGNQFVEVDPISTEVEELEEETQEYMHEGCGDMDDPEGMEDDLDEIEDEDEIDVKYNQMSHEMHLQKPVNKLISGSILNTKDVSHMKRPRPPLSTHVMDTARGCAVAGLQVSLYKLIDGRWTYINEGVTGNDGKFWGFFDAGDFMTGRYKLHYDVDRYFETKQVESLYPFIEIVIDCKSVNENYHIGLLISPYGYSTFKGSS